MEKKEQTRAERIAEYRRKQPLDELKRKAEKSRERANHWTAEEIDYAWARADDLIKHLKFD